MRAGYDHARQRGVTIHPDERIDPFGHGWIISSKSGFAPCPWALDVAEFARPRVGERILDLGCGSAALPLAIAEIEPEHGSILGADLSCVRLDQGRRNLALHEMEHTCLIRADIRHLRCPPVFDLVVSNPPFYPEGWGRISDNPDTVSATHALNGDVKDFVDSAQRCLAPHGRMVFIFDADRLSDLLLALACTDFRVKELRFLYDDRQRASRVMLMMARGGGLIIDSRGQSKG